MRPGLMLSALRSLELDVRAYDGEEGRRELSAAHLSTVIDLADSVRDLCAIFPRSREIEAEAVSLDLPMQRMPEIRDAIGSVVAKVNASDGATEGGRAAINASAADLAHQRDSRRRGQAKRLFPRRLRQLRPRRRQASEGDGPHGRRRDRRPWRRTVGAPFVEALPRELKGARRRRARRLSSAASRLDALARQRHRRARNDGRPVSAAA